MRVLSIDSERPAKAGKTVKSAVFPLPETAQDAVFAAPRRLT